MKEAGKVSKRRKELKENEESLRLKSQCLELGIYDLIWEARNFKFFQKKSPKSLASGDEF